MADPCLDPDEQANCKTTATTKEIIRENWTLTGYLVIKELKLFLYKDLF